MTTKHKKTDVHERITKQDRNNTNDPHKKHPLGTVSKKKILDVLNWFNGAPTSPLVQMWMFGLYTTSLVLLGAKAKFLQRKPSVLVTLEEISGTC